VTTCSSNRVLISLSKEGCSMTMYRPGTPGTLSVDQFAASCGGADSGRGSSEQQSMMKVALSGHDCVVAAAAVTTLESSTWWHRGYVVDVATLVPAAGRAA
jgi:hypothetical protein